MLNHFKKSFFVFLFFISVFTIKSNTSNATMHSDFIKVKFNEALEILEKTDENDPKRLQIIVDKYAPYLDFEWNAKMALGRPFQQFSDTEKKEYIDLYTEFLSYTWLPKLNYDRRYGIKFVISDKTEKLNDKDENVSIVIMALDGKSYNMTTRVRCENKNDCRILNLSAEGVDLALSYRVQFTSYIEEHQGKAQSIIEHLKQQVGKLRAKAKKQGAVLKIKHIFSKKK